MARQRDHSAIYQRRVERARAEGFASLREQKAAQKAGANAAEWRQRADERAAEARQRAAESRRQIFDYGENRLVTDTARGKGWGLIDRLLAGHGTRPVTMRVVLKNGDVRNVWEHGYGAHHARQIRSREDAADAVNASLAYAGEPISADDIESVQFELTEGGV